MPKGTFEKERLRQCLVTCALCQRMIPVDLAHVGDIISFIPAARWHFDPHYGFSCNQCYKQYDDFQKPVDGESGKTQKEQDSQAAQTLCGGRRKRLLGADRDKMVFDELKKHPKGTTAAVIARNINTTPSSASLALKSYIKQEIVTREKTSYRCVIFRLKNNMDADAKNEATDKI